MASFKSVALLALAAGAVTASPVAPTRTTGEGACAEIASMQKAYKASFVAQNPGATVTPMMTAPVALATECLFSVPINRKAALEQLTGVQRYLQFQSTLGFQKNPPKEDGFQAPQPLDLVAQITDLSHKVRAKEITKEYDFELKLRNIIASANDGHLTATMGGLLAIQFDSPFNIVSVSKDGVRMPEIFQGIINQKGELEATGSAIIGIDGLNVTEYLNKIAFGTGLQSPDARFNGLSPSKGRTGQVQGDGFFRHRRRYPGKDGFSVRFANGTTQDYQFTASIAGNFANVTDANSFYDVFVKGGQMLASAPNPRCGKDGVLSRVGRIGKKVNAWREHTPISPPQVGLKPEMTDKGGIFAGYFLKSDTAVIKLTAFAPECWSDVPETIGMIQKFLNLCRQRKATKLILDITNNGGGYIMMGYDLFMQLFPDTLPYSGQRNRECAAGLIEARAFADLSFDRLATIANSNDTEKSALAFAATWSNWAYSVNLNDDYKPFKNVEELIGPVRINKDRYSSLWRFNATEPIFGLGVEDYNAQPSLTQPFAAENIILLTDGQCSSTCSTFSEFMQTQKKVKSVAIGGIPTPGRGMPLVGGVRGSEILSYQNLLDSANAVEEFSPTQDPEQISSRKRDLPQKLPLPISGNVNSLDNVRKGHEAPLQFVEEAATCRMFYTKETLANIEALWNSIDDAAFGSGKGCAVGSLKN
ncbi:hypothetical protein H072_4525 [Dactylellina haptotyla CBS 200.50]|uniref:Uncharacterized protein n=1 Tax=Dactylellina haptotyla (strain CBS 200.50) TaxID=1284197 RepID=S8BQ34_DACHA|nr:hypothetical protein H072_4525 [Dactylellina haptotyla CBS 200.50]